MMSKQHHRRYGRCWKRIRDKYVAEHPFCQICGKPAEEVHHIIPICEGGQHDRKNNLMALCKVCHAQIHYAERKNKE